jgi:hypothetical protein
MRFVLLFLVAVMSQGCSWFNKDEPTPAYILVQPFTVTTTTPQGSSSHNITDGWVYVDGQSMGCFQLPAKIPCLLMGTREVRVDPGIMNNGFSGERKIYPFFQPFTASMALSPAGVTTVQPSTIYYTDLDFWLEDFEDAGIQFAASSSSQAAMTVYNGAEAFEGNACGKLELAGTNTYARIESTGNLTLPKGGARVYLELNYACNAPFHVGVIHNSSGSDAYEYVVSISSTYTGTTPFWKKVYIDLTDRVSSDASSASQDIYFELTRAQDDADAAVYVDNIKIIHFNN